MADIVLVAHDAAPSRCFDQLSIALVSANPTVSKRVFTCHGKGTTVDSETLRSSINGAKLVILGMSSTAEFAELELRAGKIAIELDVPVALYSDVPLAVYRARQGAWFYDIAQKAKLVLGLLPNEMGQLKALFPVANHHHTGNPIREEDAFPKFSHAEVRSKLKLLEDDIVILASGGKFAAANMAMWTLLFEACATLDIRDRIEVIVSPHPGDPTLRAIDGQTGKPLKLYEELCEEAPVHALYVTKEIMATMDILPGVNLVVEFTGSASVGAAYLNIPAISPTFGIAMSKFSKESGLRMVECVEQSASIAVSMEVTDVARIIAQLLKPSSRLRRDLIASQKISYPRPQERGQALKALVYGILQFIQR